VRASNTTHPEQEKHIARVRYANRQIDKFIKASLDNKGYLKFKDLVDIHNYYNIKVYG
jgi:hypothetical protein